MAETVLTSADVGDPHEGLELRPLFTGRVLLVDDMHDDVALLTDLLAPLQASIATAQSAEEALALVDGQPVDLVITDLNMPGATGLDLARDLRGRYGAPAVIFITGSLSAKDRIAALELGAVAYLQKPVDVEHLIGLAREILRSRRESKGRSS